MATQAGWAAGDIHADVTGITLSFSGHEAMRIVSSACEITGWEWFCDEAGDIPGGTGPGGGTSSPEGVDIRFGLRISDAEVSGRSWWTAPTAHPQSEWPAITT